MSSRNDGSPKKYLSLQNMVDNLQEDLRVAYKLLAEKDVEVTKL